MVEVNLKTAKILTSSKLSDRFLDTKIYEPTNPDEARYGNTYLLVEVTTPWFPTARITKLIHSTFLEEYYQASENSREIKRFEDGLRAVNKKLSELAGSGQTEWIGNLNAVIATVCRQRLFLSHTGTAEAYLFRHNKISHITEDKDISKNSSPIQTFSALINGELELQDRIVFSNSEMYNFVSIDTMRSAISQISPNIAVDEIANHLFREKADKVNAIFIYFSPDEAPDSRTKTALPDTIFLDRDESSGKFFRRGMRPKAMLFSLKRMIINLGLAVILVRNFLVSLLKKGKRQPAGQFGAGDKLKPEARIEDISYMTSSVNLNLSRDTGLSKKTGAPGGLKGVVSFFKTLFSKIAGLNKKWLYASIAALIILLIAGGILFRIKSNPSAKIDMTATVASAQEKISSADTQAALHNNDGARKLLLEAKTMLEEIRDKPKSPVEVIILLEKIEEKLNKVNLVNIIDNPKELANLSALGANFKTSHLIYLNGALYAINQNGGQIIIVIADKGDKRIAVELPSGAGEARIMAAFEGDRVLNIFSSQNRIFEYSIAKNKLEEKKSAKDEPFVSATAMGTYVNSIYLLSKNEGKFIKYSPSGGGYDTGRNVYRPGITDLSNVNSLAIDGNIYLLHQNGRIEKTIRGSIDTNFVLKNIPEPNSALDSPEQIYTGLDSTSLYVLESKKRRIIELNKNGEYLRQFVFKNLSDITGLAVNEKTKKLYLLADNRIFEIEL